MPLVSASDLRGVTLPPATSPKGAHPHAAFQEEQGNEEHGDQNEEDMALGYKVADRIKAKEEAEKAAAAEEKMKQLELEKGATEDTVMGEVEGEVEVEGAPPSPESSTAGSQK